MMRFLQPVIAALLTGGIFFSTAASAADSLPPTGVVMNRAPLVNIPFAALPLGSVRPQGWLLTQCEMQREGLTGHAEEIYANDLGTNSGWLGGTGEGWERGPYYFKGLIALAYTLNDAPLKQRAQKWVDWLLTHQWSDGFIGPSSNNDWWPRMVATYALRDYYEATADARVPLVLSNYFNYMLVNLPTRPLIDWGKARAGDQMDVALWLYNRNGDMNLLTLVNLLHQQADDWSGIFTSNNFALYGTDFHPKHNVNVEQALKLPPVYYQLSKQPSDAQALTLGFDHLMRENGLACGINSGTEFLSGNASVQGVELCAIAEAMLSLETATRITGNPLLADRLETISFNALPAALANHIKAHQYYTLPNNVIAINGSHGYNQDYGNGSVPGPNSGFPCCRYEFHMAWPKFIQNAWAATDDGGLAALAYGPMVVNTLVAGQQVQITEDTAYPFEEQVRLQVAVTNTINFPLALRIPGWCSNATITVNGQSQTGISPGSFYRLQRTWANGDSVVIHLPMPIQSQVGPSRSVAINRGPLVYSLRIGENWTVRTPDPLGLGFDELEVRPTTPWNYALQLNPTNFASSFQFTNYATTTNPFDPANPSVALIASAKRLPEWTVGWRGTHAFEPPVSPAASTNPLETVSLVPFGAQHLRVSWFPYLGTPAPKSGSFTENFDATWSQRWTVFGGNWSARNGSLSTVPASASGAKALALATGFTNFTYDADVSVGSVGNAGLVFRASKPDIGADAYCGYYVGLNAGSSTLEFGYSSNGWHAITNVTLPFTANTFYHLKVKAQGSRIRIYVTNTNQPVVDMRDNNFASGMLGVRDYCTDGDRSLSSFTHLVATELPAGMQAWYRLEGDATDAGSYGNDGTLVGNVQFVSGKSGALAAQFDGSANTFISMPRSVSTNFTISFWVKTTAAGGSGQWYNGQGLVDGEVFGVANDFGISLVGNCAAFGVGNPDITILSTNLINNGAWHHVAATRDAVSGLMCLYVDGSLQASITGPTGLRAAPANLRIGSLQTGVAGGFLAGTMDDVQIFDRVFSAAEVPTLMNHAPQLAPISDATILAGRMLTMTNIATDADGMAQTLTFSLINEPNGVALSSTNGQLQWRPNISQAGANYPFAVRVTDNGTPSMSATQFFSVAVLEPAAPVIEAAVYQNGQLNLQVSGDAGPDYSIYASTNLMASAGGWNWLLTTNPAALPFQFSDAMASVYRQRFYQVQLGP